MNNGNGTFAAAVTYAAGDFPFRIFSADFNVDGKPDLALTNLFANTISVFINNGNGTFAAAVAYAAGGTAPYDIHSADFNNDGKSDILFQNPSTYMKIWFMNNTTRTGSSVVNPGAEDVNGSYAGAGWNVGATGDYNADGKVDIIHQYTDGTMSEWFMSGVDFLATPGNNPDNPRSDWRLIGPR